MDEIGGEFGGFKGRIRFNAQAAALNVLENRMIAVEGAIEHLLVITGELNREDDDLETGWAK